MCDLSIPTSRALSSYGRARQSLTALYTLRASAPNGPLAASRSSATLYRCVSSYDLVNRRLVVLRWHQAIPGHLAGPVYPAGRCSQWALDFPLLQGYPTKMSPRVESKYIRELCSYGSARQALVALGALLALYSLRAGAPHGSWTALNIVVSFVGEKLFRTPYGNSR
jgi:hypothetical protein